MCGAAQRVHLRSMRICACALLRRMRRGRDPRGKAPNASFSFVLSSGRANPEKTMFSGHPRRKSLLHESRKPYPCHTFRSDAAEIFTPSCNFEATHAQRCNSCRSGACPNVQFPHPCRLRRRQEHLKNLAIITARPETRLVRLAKRYASQPHAAAPATPGGKRRNRAKGTPPTPDPPRWCSPSKKGGGGGARRPVSTPPAPALRHCKS